MGSHIALFFGKERTGSFYLHRRDFAELPSGEKKNRKCFRNTKDLRALGAASLQEPILFSASGQRKRSAHHLLSGVTVSYSSQTHRPEGEESPDSIPKNPSTGREYLGDFWRQKVKCHRYFISVMTGVGKSVGEKLQSPIRDYSPIG